MAEINHEAIIGKHEEIFKNIRETLNYLKEADEKRNGKYDLHVKESIAYRGKIDQHEKDIIGIKDGHKEIRGWAVAILLTILGSIVYQATQNQKTEWLYDTHIKQTEKNTR
ncbi:MAG: hypothetical protein ABFC84_16625 [Veillonellales bacterium]